MGTSKQVPEKDLFDPISLVLSSQIIRKPVKPTKPAFHTVFVAKSKFFLWLQLNNKTNCCPNALTMGVAKLSV
jgi:hypothetical protein